MESHIYGIQGDIVSKEAVKDYIRRVKEYNSNGVVLCIDTEEETRDNINTNGAFNVYLEMKDKAYIDFLGKGFDVGGITRGKENHEAWSIDWEDILFVTPRNMNQYRNYMISDSEYINTAKRRLQSLLDKGYKREEIKGIIPKSYSPMSLSIKEMILDEILVPLYSKQDELIRSGLKSFGVQGMIIGDRLFPVEFNRRERFAKKEFFEKLNDNER